MEDNNRNELAERKENDIIFSKAIKAGKRIYYLDVKRSRNGEPFLAITESKKVVNGFQEERTVQYQKHKIFLYKEDFDKFSNGLTEVLDFIQEYNYSMEESAVADLHEQENECSKY
ncbi:MAG: DUF3276 family protein [Bacteroidales bacterium]